MPDRLAGAARDKAADDANLDRRRDQPHRTVAGQAHRACRMERIDFVVVGAIDGAYSRDLLQKVQLGLDELVGEQMFNGEVYPSPLKKE